MLERSYPDFVPPFPREFFSEEIKKLNLRLNSIAAEILHRKWNIERLSSVDDQTMERGKIGAAETRRAIIRADLECISRLAGLEAFYEMEPVYTLLNNEFSCDEEYLRYFCAAYISKVDYREYRRIKKEVDQSLAGFVRNALTAARCLEHVQKHGLVLPAELLPHNDLRCVEQSFDAALDFALIENSYVSCETRLPDLADYLVHVAGIAKKWRVELGISYGAVDHVLKFKQGFQSDYIRGFRHLLEYPKPIAYGRNLTNPLLSILTEEDGMPPNSDIPVRLTDGVLKAMTSTAKVVLDEDITLATVRGWLFTEERA